MDLFANMGVIRFYFILFYMPNQDDNSRVTKALVRRKQEN